MTLTEILNQHIVDYTPITATVLSLKETKQSSNGKTFQKIDLADSAVPSGRRTVSIWQDDGGQLLTPQDLNQPKSFLIQAYQFTDRATQQKRWALSGKRNGADPVNPQPTAPSSTGTYARNGGGEIRRECAVKVIAELFKSEGGVNWVVAHGGLYQVADLFAAYFDTGTWPVQADAPVEPSAEDQDIPF